MLEPALTVALVLVAVLAPRGVLRIAAPAAAAVRALARRRTASVLAVGLAAFLSGALASALLGPPLPRVHDEFSYLLAADTFAHGRLANPTPPHEQHFETFHVVVRPTYASKYPPGQGALLAAGQVAGGHPVLGVWLASALAAAAVCWMLQAWLTPGWALYGGLVYVLRFGFAHYWSHGYWGGAAAAFGGALLFGALRRAAARPRARTGLALGAGAAVLAVTRPFEGLVALALASPFVPGLVRRSRAGAAPLLRRVLPAAGAVVLLLAGGLAIYNDRVAGDPLVLPYQVYQRTYDPVPIFIWQEADPQAREGPEVMQRFYERVRARRFEGRREPARLLDVAAGRALGFAGTYVGVPLLLGLLALPWALRDAWMRLAAAVGLGLLLVNGLVETHFLPHYDAPLTALVLALVLQGLRHVRTLGTRGRPVGPAVVLVLPLACAVSAASVLAGGGPPRSVFAVERARLAEELARRPGRELVLVGYAPGHDPHEEWVFNGADLRRAQVVWARELGGATDRRLAAAFGDRRLLFLEADARPPALRELDADLRLVAPEDGARVPVSGPVTFRAVGVEPGPARLELELAWRDHRLRGRIDLPPAAGGARTVTLGPDTRLAPGLGFAAVKELIASSAADPPPVRVRWWIVSGGGGARSFAATLRLVR